MEHIGETSHFIASGFSEWLIPIENVTQALNYPIVNIGGLKFYLAHGAKPNHFLSDAEFKTRQENIETVKKAIEEMLKGVCQ